MHSHIWGKSDVICYWCILEFKSSLIQTKGWIEGSEERQKERDNSLCQYFTPHSSITTLTGTSEKHVPEIWPHRHTSQCQNTTFHYHFQNVCRWNHHAPDEFSPTYSNNIILRAILTYFSNLAVRLPNDLFTFGLDSLNAFAGKVPQ